MSNLSLGGSADQYGANIVIIYNRLPARHSQLFGRIQSPFKHFGVQIGWQLNLSFSVNSYSMSQLHLLTPTQIPLMHDCSQAGTHSFDDSFLYIYPMQIEDIQIYKKFQYTNNI